MDCAGVAGATKYILQATRAGTTGVDPILQTVTEAARAAANGQLSMDLSGASDGHGGRGRWRVQIKASNDYAPAASTPAITHTASESAFSAPSEELVVGPPEAAAITSVAGTSPGSATLVFT